MGDCAWGYGDTDGPATWGAKFPNACGLHQSPINIQTSEAEFDTSLCEHPLEISYKSEDAMVLSNTGASIKADCKNESTLTGGPLGNKVYKLAQFHLHWGAKDDRGAEHTIDGKVYSAELHLVHWNSTDYNSFQDAVDKSDGLAVLCMFIKVGDNAHSGFDTVSAQLANTSFKGDTCCLGGTFDPTSLLPNNRQRFWTYPGSLTTPPCYESVQFILFEEILEFSKDQMQALRSLHFGGDGSCAMGDNFRPPCAIGNRTVMASFAR